MDTAHWSQEIVVKPMEEILVPNTTNSCSNNNPNNNPPKPSSSLERRVRPQKEAAINCPRCNSTNTKFCYYNNYSLSQPRYFCKTCRRYWTEGGSLRNIPVGGGSRKNKRSSSSSSSATSLSSSMSKKLPDLVVPPASTAVLSQNPRMMHHDHGQDLNLGFPSHDFKTISELIQVPNFDGNKNMNSNASNATTATTNTTTATTSAQLSALELLTGITTRGMMNSFMPIPIPDPNSVYSSSGQLMIPMPEFKIPSLNFSLDGMGNGGDGTYGSGLHENTSGRLLFPFEDLKTSTTTTTAAAHDDQNRDQNGDSNGYWNGVLGGGSW